MMDVRIPNLAEGVSSGTIVSIEVTVGQTVKKGQTLLELETEKAVAPVPSPCDGTVQTIEAAMGETVSVGRRVIVIAGAEGVPVQPSEASLPKPEPNPEKKPVRPTKSEEWKKTGLPPAAPPSVRKLARELGIDLDRVAERNGGGRIGIEDVRAYIRELQDGKKPAAPGSDSVPIDDSIFGPVRRGPLTGIRKKIVENLSRSWRNIPHVTQFAEADAGRITDLRRQYLAEYERRGVRLTLTVFIVKAVANLLMKYPIFNSRLDEVAGEIVFKDYWHIGLAVDTEQGLMVPVIRDVDKKTLLELAKEIEEVAGRARARKVSVEDLRGGTFTISNQGGIGGSFFTPIINYPEAAILGVGKTVEKPVVKDGRHASARMIPLGLSYDHRLIDGGSAARFVTDLTSEIETFREEFVRPA